MVLLIGFEATAAPASSPSALPAWSTTQAQANRYVSAHGLRAFAGGYSEDGLEFWTFPLQLVSGYALDFVRPGAPSLPGITVLTSVEVDPFGVTRLYTGPDFQVRERIATRAKHRGVLVRYSVQGRATWNFGSTSVRPST